MKGQALAICLVIVSGVCTYILLISTMQSLETTQKKFYTSFGFADIFGSLKRAPDREGRRIADIKGGRCCQRETVSALKEAAQISRETLPVALLAEQDFACRQFDDNKECIRKQCPLWRESSEASGTD